MAESFEFSFEGLEEFERDLKKAIEKAPAQAEETLAELAKEFKNAAKKKANAELKPHERKENQKKKAIKRKWGHKLVDDNLGATALVWNSARHFHLVENGHNLVRGGRVIGFVPGKHIMEKTRNDYKDIVPERFEKMVDDILKECDLD
ncbi:MAG: HK97 gp10 family phage protein [Lachnospiraceae bacterium]|nr:HK97 gp10 family phage protein [Lachnospiraceae bacterium]